MFASVLRRLSSRLRDVNELPAPVLEDPGTATRIREGLEAMRTGADRRFVRFFLRGVPLLVRRDERGLFEDLAAAGLAARFAPTFYAPCARIFPLAGRFLATDLLDRTGPDQVFSLMFEQAYMTANSSVRRGDRVLELCAGSGVLGLFAADTAASVTGVDVSERAIRFARLNLGLSGRPDAIELLRGSLYGPVGDRRFDLVLVNPPFELVPAGCEWFLHSDGGEDGLDVVREILAGARDHLEPGGRVDMITWSPGSAEGTELVRLLVGALGEARITVERLGTEPLANQTDRFRDAPDHAAWCRRLADRGFDRVDFVRAIADTGGPPGVEFREPEDAIAAAWDVADGWG